MRWTAFTLRSCLALMLSVTIPLSGCKADGPDHLASPDGGATGLSPAQERMRQQGEDFNRTMVEGAVAGAVIGGLIGALTGHNDRGRSIALGAAAGAAIGGLGGYWMGKQKESYVNEEARLDSMIADVRTDNQRLAGLVESSQQVIAEHRKELGRLEKAVAAKRLSRQEARVQLAAMRDDKAYLEQTVDNLKKRRDEYQYASRESRRTTRAASGAELDREIARMNSQIGQLESQLAGLARAMEVSPLA